VDEGREGKSVFSLDPAMEQEGIAPIPRKVSQYDQLHDADVLGVARAREDDLHRLLVRDDGHFLKGTGSRNP
jgi:hypothetical protein